jgi:hypothetical protein
MQGSDDEWMVDRQFRFSTDKVQTTMRCCGDVANRRRYRIRRRMGLAAAGAFFESLI